MSTYRLKFITPCFCAGANQQLAEVRPSAIRGELRWWFRCLGGTKAEEDEVFGNAAGSGKASSVLIRVSNVVRAANSYTPSFVSPNDPGAYLHYLLTAPNDAGHSRMWETAPAPESKTRGVIRDSSQLPPGTEFDLQILKVRGISNALREKLDSAIDAMLRFGSIGYRRTRGFGAWVNEASLVSRGETEQRLNGLKSFQFTWKFAQGGNANALIVLQQVEGKLKANKTTTTGYRLDHPAQNKTPLGYSHGRGDRQASAVLFRPCPFRTKNGDIQFALLELQAPDSVLGTNTKKTRIIPATP